MPPWVQRAIYSKERKLRGIKKATKDWPYLKTPEKVLQLRIDQNQLPMIQNKYSAQYRHMKLDNRFRWNQFRQSQGKDETRDLTNDFIVSLGNLESLDCLPPRPSPIVKPSPNPTHAVQPSFTPSPTNAESPLHPPSHIMNTTPASNQGEVNRGNFDAPEEHDAAAWAGDYPPPPEMREEYHVGGPQYGTRNDIRVSCSHPQQIETMQEIHQAERSAWNAHMYTTAAKISSLEYDLNSATGALKFHKKELSLCAKRLENASAAKETGSLVIKALELALEQLGGDPDAVKKKCIADRPPSKVVRTVSKKRKRKSTDGGEAIDLVAGPLGKKQKGSSIGGAASVVELYPVDLEKESLNGETEDPPGDVRDDEERQVTESAGTNDETQQDPNDQAGTEPHEMQEGSEEADGANEREMLDEFDQSNTDAASEPGSQEMVKMDDSQEGFEENGSDEDEPENHEHPVDKRDLASTSVDQTGEGSLGDGTDSLLNHSEEGSAPHTNREGTPDTAADTNQQIPSAVIQDIKQETKDEASEKIKEEPSETVTTPSPAIRLRMSGKIPVEKIIYIELSDGEEDQLPKSSTSKKKSKKPTKRKTAKKGTATAASS